MPKLASICYRYDIVTAREKETEKEYIDVYIVSNALL